MKKIILNLVLLGILFFIPAVTLSQQSHYQVFADGITSGPYICEPDWIEVMFNDESVVRLRDGQLFDFRTDATSGLGSILSGLQWYKWQRISEVPENTLDQWEINGELNSGKEVYNLNNIYHLMIPKGNDIWAISKAIEDLPGVILARPVPKPMALPLPGNYQPQQAYEDPASNNPSGIDAEYAWTQAGGTGTGITVCDLEYSWNYNHADITKAVGSQINTNVVDPFSDNNHGTAVIGELVSDNNGWGTTGICYGSNLKTCGTYYGVSPLWNVPGAISLAIASLNQGDIILLEQQWDYTGSGAYIPIEWWMNYSPNQQTNNGVYAAIVNAVANGIHVIEAGGNGNFNTDNLTWLANSGGVIVGAGGATSTNDRQRLSFSSYGQRFDLQGWGEHVVTTGYGTLYNSQGANYYYTSTFSGTSSASPIVAGAFACASGYYISNISMLPPSPSFLLNHFKTNSTPQVFPPSGTIGPRPDLLSAIQNFQPVTQIDWGDAPDPPYPTLSANLGANHTITPGMFLGMLVDAESDGQPTFNAMGDDINNDDEDGVTFLSPLNPGSVVNINVIASNNGFLNAWIDYNGNGSWGDPGEQIFIGQIMIPGLNALSFTVPATAPPGLTTYARFRFSSILNLPFFGSAPNGEVEDYMVFIEESGQYDWGDAPDPSFPTLSVNNGANHKILSGFFLGNMIDPEQNGQPHPNALGDDITNIDDEDGITFSGPLIPGQNVTITVISSMPGFVNGWIDFNMNGTWGDPGEQVLIDQPVISGTTVVLVLVPSYVMPGTTFSRFRLTSYPGVSFVGPAMDGEVEDYEIPVEEPQQFDWGDAPDQPYPTLSASNGANHMVIPGFFLGNLIDAEPDGQPHPNALGDDLNNLADEDGVTFSGPIIPGQPFTINVIASAQGVLNAWIDFMQNGNWIDPGEQIAVDLVLMPGLNSFVVTAPAGIGQGMTFARFRFSTITGLSFMGSAPDGEVEDYQVTIEFIDQLDWGDAPDPTYPTLSISNGANHLIVPGLFLGNLIDPEPDGQPDPGALGDDNNNLADEDGVVFTSPIIPGQPANLTVTASAPGLLNVWFDFNANGTWIDPGEQIFTDLLLGPGPNLLIFLVPATATNGTTFARFRFSTLAGLSFTGFAPDGEVEDYKAIIQPQLQIDWGDAPDPSYPTLAVSNGASHIITGGIYLGTLIDAETDGIPDANALGDDNNNLDDEDGIIFTSLITSNSTATITAISSVGGVFLNGWIDFNKDGDWADAGENIFTDITLNAGTNNLTFNTPAATLGSTFSRFRICSYTGLSYIGQASDGEVEDYKVTISPLYDFGDAPSPYPTLAASNGARHKYNYSVYLGSNLDTEVNGIPDPNALGDDNNNLDDEDGITFTSQLVKGRVASFIASASVAGVLNAWIDYNIDGDWADGNERIFTNLAINAGTNNLSFNIPVGATAGTTFIRFRFSIANVASFTGIAATGEVEDYEVLITEELDYGDAPDPNYPTLILNNGAVHFMDGITWLGAGVDADPDGQPDINALGDDNDGNDDEDGVIFGTVMIPGNSVTLQVNASVSGLLNAWIDFNMNGLWSDPGEQIFIDAGLVPGLNNISFIVPATVLPGKTYARFRFSTASGLSFTGMAPDGEVEDYCVWIVNPQGYKMHWPQMPKSGGWDVEFAMSSLADDFLCTQTGPVSNIRFWISWMQNLVGVINNFTVNICSDIPANQSPNGYSIPGNVLWTGNFTLGQFTVMDMPLNWQGWYDVSSNNWGLNDHNRWQEITIPNIPNPFIQQIGNIYWLEINFSTLPSIGWKESGSQPFNDASVFWHGVLQQWIPVIDPIAGNNIDLSFIISSNPFSPMSDWGDAPDPTYPTLAVNNGAFHNLDGITWLGGMVDAENDGQPDPVAMGDDNANDDEDGIFFNTPLITGQIANITTTASVQGYLNAWLDYNMNGSWADPGEQIFTDMLLAPGINNLSFNIPPQLVSGFTFARFRFSSVQGLSFNGPAPDGEVEDYQVNIEPEPSYKWLQLPDLSPLGMDVEANFNPSVSPPIVLADDYLCTMTGPLTTITIWGSWFQDLIPFGDPNAVQFTLSIHEDIPANQSPTGYSMPGNLLWVRTFNPGEFMSSLYAFNLTEGWFNPVLPFYTPFGDTQCWMYKFNINGEFVQTGTPDEPKVYWLDVQASPFDPDPNCKFGWKTSETHWNDDGVYGIGMEPYMGPWYELRYPQGHPLYDQSIDLAFMIEGLENPYILVDLKAIMEGPFNGSTMNNTLNASGFLPLTQPYNTNPAAIWNYSGSESVTAIPVPNVVDWVEIELRETPGGPATATIATRIAQKASFMLNNGVIAATDGTSIPKFYLNITQNLYAVVWHRNHLGIMSSVPLTLSPGGVYTYDFTPSSTTVYGGSLGYKQLAPNIWGMYSADGDADQQITNADKNNIWNPQSGLSGYYSGDFNLDTQVNNIDKTFFWRPNAGKGSQVP